MVQLFLHFLIQFLSLIFEWNYFRIFAFLQSLFDIRDGLKHRKWELIDSGIKKLSSHDHCDSANVIGVSDQWLETEGLAVLLDVSLVVQISELLDLYLDHETILWDLLFFILIFHRFTLLIH